MFGEIIVVNVRGMEVNKVGVVYVGRACNGWIGSALGNKFYMKNEGERDNVIKQYRVWLWKVIEGGKGVEFDAFKQLVERYENGESLVLGCWCAPKPCHAQVLKSAIEWYAMRLIKAVCNKVLVGVETSSVDWDESM